MNPYATQFTRSWLAKGKEKAERDMTNRKPYRTRGQKAEAKRLARQDSDGAWRSTAPCEVRTTAPKEAAR